MNTINAEIPSVTSRAAIDALNKIQDLASRLDHLLEAMRVATDDVTGGDERQRDRAVECILHFGTIGREAAAEIEDLGRELEEAATRAERAARETVAN